MSDTTDIGILLSDKADGAQIGFIKFDASGMLIYQAIKTGLHVYAFKPINRLLTEQWIKEPLYKKHAHLLDQNKKLPRDVLEQEAKSCAEFLNTLESPLQLGGSIVEARVVKLGPAND